MSKPYWWFQGASVRALYDQLTEYGPDSARLEVHKEGDKLYFHVRADGSDEAPPPINDSHTCPPQCP